jgi:hypothetical protein
MKACKSVNRYKGILKPRCNGGRGCDACWLKYATGPLRVGQEVLDIWFSFNCSHPDHQWGTGKVTLITKRRIHIQFSKGGPRKFDFSHAKAFIRKVI